MQDQKRFFSLTCEICKKFLLNAADTREFLLPMSTISKMIMDIINLSVTFNNIEYCSTMHSWLLLMSFSFINSIYIACMIHKIFFPVKWPHQWRSSSALKTGRREVPGSILGHACLPSCLEFSMVFSKTRVNQG